MAAYYNENDPKAAAWLRELIREGHIAPGEVDERSIVDVRPVDLRGFVQCHFFAGIGVWSYALRRAGWDDNRPVWTGSCPCQPFSAAGKGAGFDDERHLWPHWHYLIEHSRPASIFGEQVASKVAGAWIDLVQDDMEAMGYTFGAVPFPSSSIGAPHIRDRLYWVAIAPSDRREYGAALPGGDGEGEKQGGGRGEFGINSGFSRMANAETERHFTGVLRNENGEEPATYCSRQDEGGRLPGVADAGGTSGMADTGLIGFRGRQPGSVEGEKGESEGKAGQRQRLRTDFEHGGARDVARPLNGFWRDADWLLCRDEKWRPVEPGTFPLAHGAAARVGRLRGYGNAINAEVATAFIETMIGV